MGDSANEERAFRGIWFPAEVWLDRRLTAIEKMVLMEIDSLSNDDGCYASNEYIADFCQCSQSKVSSAIANLRKLGYIKVSSFDGRKRVLESCLPKFRSLPSKNWKAASQNLEERILVESTSKKNKEDIEESELISEIVSYLNERTGKSYRLSSRGTQRLIKARLKEGFTVDDFKRVIDNKTAQWKDDPNMNGYLRPQTLFGPKFESYLNEIPQQPKFDWSIYD